MRPPPPAGAPLGGQCVWGGGWCCGLCPLRVRVPSPQAPGLRRGQPPGSCLLSPQYSTGLLPPQAAVTGPRTVAGGGPGEGREGGGRRAAGWGRREAGTKAGRRCVGRARRGAGGGGGKRADGRPRSPPRPVPQGRGGRRLRAGRLRLRWLSPPRGVSSERPGHRERRRRWRRGWSPPGQVRPPVPALGVQSDRLG